MRCRAALPLLALLLVPPAAFASARNDYDAAITAANARRWDESRRLLERAIAEKPKSAKGRGGYFPYFYLGVAWQGAGSCRRALDAWAEEERQGAIAGNPLANDLRVRITQCRTVLSALDEAAAGVEREAAALLPQLARVQSAAAAARTSAARGVLAEQRVSAETVRRLVDQVKAEARPAAAAEGRDKLLELRRQVTTMSQQLDGAEQLIAQHEAAARSSEQTANAGAALRHEMGNSRRALDGASPGAAADRLREQLAAAETALRRGNPGELVRMTTALRSLRGRLPRAPSEPSAELSRAVERFLAGDGSGTLAALADHQPKSPLETAHHCLLRAAVLFDNGAREEAQQALAACPWQREKLVLSDRFFSPEFVALAAAVPAP